MIPKIAHFRWFEEEVPAGVMDFIGRFKELHPFWEIRLWRGMPRDVPRQFRAIMDSLKIDPMVKEEVFRAWALYSFGGVFVGEDVWMLKPIDELMEQNEAFFCQSSPTRSAFVAASKPGDHRLIDAIFTSIPIPSVTIHPGVIWGAVNRWSGWKILHQATFFPFSVGANARDFLRKPENLQKYSLAKEASRKGANVDEIYGISLLGRKKAVSAMKQVTLEDTLNPKQDPADKKEGEDAPESPKIEASILDMGASLATEVAKAGVEILKGQSPLEEKGGVEERLRICLSCELFIHESGRCSKCGCRMRYKARLKRASCPVGKW